MDKNGFLDALTAYSRNPCPEIPAILDQYLNGIASNGETLYHWPLLKPLLFAKMEQVIGELQKELSSEVIPERPNVENVPFDVMHARIVEAFHKFNGAPFTIQRLCELLIDPKRHYKRSDKFLRGLEKNVLVVSTVDPFGRNVVSEIGNKHLVNGMDTVGSPFFPRDSSITSNLPPVPGWVTSAPSVTSPQSVAPTARSHLKQSQPSWQDSAVTTSVVSGTVITSLYGEQPPASQAEDVVEETVVTMDTSESSVPDSRDTGSEEEGMGREDSNTSSSSSSSSEELSANDTSDNSPDVATLTVSTDTPHTSPWLSVVAEGENKVHVSSSDAAHDDRCGGVPLDPPGESDKSESETSPSQAKSDEQADSFLSSSEVDSSESESGEKSSSRVDGGSSEVPMDTSCVQQDSYNDSTGFDTAFTSGEINTLEHSATSSESEDLSGVSSEASRMGTTIPSTDMADSPSTDMTDHPVLKSSQIVDSSSHSEITISPDVSSKDVSTPASRDERTSTSNIEKPDCSLDSTPSSPPTLPVDLSSSLHYSASRSQRMNPSSPDSPSDCQEPQAKRRRLSHETSHANVSSKTSTDVTLSSDFPVSSNMSDEGIVSSDFSVSSNTSSNVNVSSDLPVSSNVSGDVTVSPDLPVSSNTPGDEVSVLPDFPVSSNTPGDEVTVSPDLPVSSNTPGDEVTVLPDFPVSSNTPGDEVTVLPDFPVSSNTPDDEVNVSSDFPVSSNTSDEVTMSPGSDSISATESNVTSGDPVDPAWVQDSDIHDEPVDSEPAVRDDDFESRECVASPPSQEASSSDSQGFDATVESQNMDTEATNVEESAKLEEFDQIEELKKTEELTKTEETTESNLASPQN